LAGRPGRAADPREGHARDAIAAARRRLPMVEFDPAQAYSGAVVAPHSRSVLSRAKAAALLVVRRPAATCSAAVRTRPMIATASQGAGAVASKSPARWPRRMICSSWLVAAWWAAGAPGCGPRARAGPSKKG